MSNHYIVGFGLAGGKDRKRLERLPIFRKASKNMITAFAATENLMASLTELMGEFGDEVGIVLGSGHGEIEITLDFYEKLGKQNLARPILFQNCLHNSTLGFLS